MKYQLSKFNNRRAFPGATLVGSGIVTLTVGLSTEGYYPEFDLVLPLIPEVPLPPQTTHKFQAVANIPFTANEVVTGQVGADVQVLTFSTPPDLGFARGEVITEALSGITAVVARRFSDGRYQVIDVSGAWAGAPDTVTSLTGGGITPGQINAAATVAFRARFDTAFVKDTTVHALYEANMCIPMGADLVGVTSGAAGTVVLTEPPMETLEMENFRAYVGNLVVPPVDAQLRFVGLMGDLAHLLNPLAADTQVQARADAGEVWWMQDFREGSEESTDVNYTLGRQMISGIWGGSAVYAGPGLGGRFQDGVVFRLHQIGGVGNVTGSQASRMLTFFDRLESVVRLGPF